MKKFITYIAIVCLIITSLCSCGKKDQQLQDAAFDQSRGAGTGNIQFLGDVTDDQIHHHRIQVHALAMVDLESAVRRETGNVDMYAVTEKYKPGCGTAAAVGKFVVQNAGGDHCKYG